MDEEILYFFLNDREALPLYIRFEEKIDAKFKGVTRKVSKTQISFSNRHVFTIASFLKAVKAKDRPKPFLTITFGLGYQKESPRIAAATEAYPNRWTHHVVIGNRDEIDDELMGWIREAYDFSAMK